MSDGQVDSEWKHHWPKFIREMETRLEAGHLEYGERSFVRHPVDLIDELSAEALDIVGWGYILWCRLRKLRAKAEGYDPSTTHARPSGPDGSA